MLQRAHQYVIAETLVEGKREETKRPQGEQSNGHPTPSIPLNSTRTEIFFQIRERGLLKALNPIKSHPERRDKRRYCRFHREYVHDTEECHDLQYQIEDLIRRGHLRQYVHEQSSLPDGRHPRDSSPQPKGSVEKQIDVIFDGPTSGGNSSSVRKAYARSEVGKRPLHDEKLDLRENLDLLEEKRADAHLRALAYRRAVNRVCPRHVKMGDLVLQKAEVRTRPGPARSWLQTGRALIESSRLSETRLIRWQ
ncbi:hypothetical protein BHE74_00035106 [Ensete ventricosum]|nr:hypothetical protein BHE74_00035106 [Ensete ventricosum]